MRWRAGTPAKAPEYIDLPHLPGNPKRAVRGFTRLFAKVSDGLVYGIEPDGTVTGMGGGGGSVATDVIWDAKGDMAIATGADTAVKLVTAANGAVLTTASGEATGAKWRLNNDGAAVAPTVNEDSGDGYAIGTRWLDTTAKKEYILLDATVGAAVWKETTSGGTGTLLASITAASAAIANTETVVVSATIAANTLAVGQSFRIRGAGVGTTGAAPGNDTFRIRIGTTTLTGNIPTSVAAAANTSVTAQPFTFEALVTIRTITASGTVIGECMVEGDNVATGLFTLLQALSATTATVVVDSTAAKLLELTFQSGAASSNATFHVATIESLVAVNTAAAGALVLLEQKTASASATLDFTTAITSTYDEYLIEFINIIPATNAAVLWLRMSTDGGSSYDAGVNYDYTSGYAYSGGVGVGSSATSSTKVLLMDAISNSATYGLVGQIKLFSPSSTALYKLVAGDLLRFDSAALGLVRLFLMGSYKITTAVNAFRFLMDTGNITSGTIRVYGIAK